MVTQSEIPFAINMVGHRYVVVDTRTGRTISVKYDKERGALRNIKLRTHDPRDINLISPEVQRLYKAAEPAAVPEIPAEPETGEALTAEEILREGDGIADEIEMTPAISEPQRELGAGEYWCVKCDQAHRETSKIGKSHLKYATIKE